MRYKDLIDDSRDKIDYYSDLYYYPSKKSNLDKIINVMNTWSRIIKTDDFDSKAKSILKVALCESEEAIWYEAGLKLTLLFKVDKNVSKIFKEVLGNSRWHPRFNVTALANKVCPEFAEYILAKSMNDVSVRVREKAADEILWIHNEKFLYLLGQRIEIETDKRVIDSIKGTFFDWDRVGLDESGRAKELPMDQNYFREREIYLGHRIGKYD
jgi:hypothetical protein